MTDCRPSYVNDPQHSTGIVKAGKLHRARVPIASDVDSSSGKGNGRAYVRASHGRWLGYLWPRPWRRRLRKRL